MRRPVCGMDVGGWGGQGRGGYHSVWSSRPKRSFMVTIMSAAACRSYRGRVGWDSGWNVWQLSWNKPASSATLQTHLCSSPADRKEPLSPRSMHVCLSAGTEEAVTGQVCIDQVAQAQWPRVEQSLLADGRKRWKLQEQKQILSLLMQRAMRRYRLQRQFTTSSTNRRTQGRGQQLTHSRSIPLQ